MDTRYVPIGGPGPADLPSEAALIPEQKQQVSVAPPRAPMQSLVASAKRITSATVKNTTFRRTNAEDWQQDAWEMYDLVGEMRFLTTTLANRMGQARFYVGLTNPDDPLGQPVPLADSGPQYQPLIDAFNGIGGGPAGFASIVKRLGVNLQVPGDSWVVGIPKWLLPDATEEDLLLALDSLDPSQNYARPSLEDMEWKHLSISEVRWEGRERVVLELSEYEDEWVKATPDELYMIRVWDPHPRRHWQADSPTRSSLPVLRELVGLTMHISAQIDSRLAGAGLFLVPASAVRALKIALGLPEDGPEDPFTDALMEAMLTPISDRSNASAIVPLVSVVPDEAAALFRLIDFSSNLDAQAVAMRTEAIRRFALGQDAPPELLLGTAGMNHWGAWLVREDVVNTHIEPPLALVCDAFTGQFLRPLALELDFPADIIGRLVVWYNVDHMIMRPNRAGDAQNLYNQGVLADDTLRDANGFDEADAPTVYEQVLRMVTNDPSLMVSPGVPVLIQQLEALINDRTPAAIEAPSTPEPQPTEPTPTQNEPESATGTEQPGAGIPEGAPEV